jgi:4-phospho-D-threonate 3-dehydrogenase / 4-phospho-D-erythronate 3-dehydrogenase
MPDLAKIGITMGDPSGIGPEIIVKALQAMPPERRSATAVVGNMDILRRADKLLNAELTYVDSLEAARDGSVPVVHVPTEGQAEIKDGQICAASGEAAYQYVVKAVELALAGRIAVIVTAPLNKAALHAAGHHFDGHTELLAQLTGARSSFMLLASDKLNAVHVTTHVSLRGATERATTERILATIRAGNEHFKALGYARPRIAVAGMNPHSGEGGIFGNEEIERIGPAIEMARKEGRSRGTRCSTARSRASSTSSSLSTTTRDTSPPSSSRSTRPSTSASACRSGARRWTTAPPSTSPGPARPARSTCTPPSITRA